MQRFNALRLCIKIKKEKNQFLEVPTRIYEAAQNGNPQAQNDLGVFIAKGEGVPQNYEVAAYLFNEAANEGNTDGIANLAQCFAEGIGVEKNLGSALELLNRIKSLRSNWAKQYIAVKRTYDREQQNQNPFFLVKITDYAESMLAGTIYMRPISDFWSLENSDEAMQNSYRGDNMESVTETFDDENIPEGSHFFRDVFHRNADVRFGNAAQRDMLLSQNMIYSMSILEFDRASNGFILPDKRIASFGKTAVIIYDCNEFLKRVTAAKVLKCGYNSWMSFKRVKYNLDFNKNQSYNEFCKESSYAWQKEFRISIDVSQGKLNKKNWEQTTDFVRATSGIGYNPNIPEQLSLHIDMSDISVSMPVSDFLELKDFDKLPIRKFIPPPYTEMLSMEREPHITVYTPMITLKDDEEKI
ncbi:MAG: sel1 repeat family protein [Lentimicrobiaceae bacterium]|nr:sel1 repeat family protein [Lentimicrobiaceae bacterium]